MNNKQFISRIIIPYYGKLPWWFDFFLVSCAKNQYVSWIIYTDDASRCNNLPFNVKIVVTSFEEYKIKVSKSLNINFNPSQPYKLNDIKPFIGLIHREEIDDIPFWGWGDLDVIYGNIYKFLMANKSYNIVCSYPDRFSGQLTFLKNKSFVNESPTKISNWENKLENNECLTLDEAEFHIHWSRPIFKFSRAARFTNRLQPAQICKKIRRVRCKDDFTTPLVGTTWRDGSQWDKHPDIWEWNNGVIRSVRDGCESPYLHFMAYKPTMCNRGKIAPWSDEASIAKFNPSFQTNSFFIHRGGITKTLPSVSL